MVHLEFWKTTSDRTCSQKRRAMLAVWGEMKQNLLDEKLVVSLTAQRKFEDLKMRHAPTIFCSFKKEVPRTPAAFRESFQVGVGHYSGTKELKKRKGTRPATTSLVSPRSFTARCYTQFKLLSDQGANIHHSELALAVFTAGLLYKRQIKNTSFYFIASPCISHQLHNVFFFQFNPTLPPVPSYCLSPSVSSSKGAWISCNQRAKEKYIWRDSQGDSCQMAKVLKKVHFQLTVSVWNLTARCMRRWLRTAHPLHRIRHKWIPRECA